MCFCAILAFLYLYFFINMSKNNSPNTPTTMPFSREVLERMPKEILIRKAFVYLTILSALGFSIRQGAQSFYNTAVDKQHYSPTPLQPQPKWNSVTTVQPIPSPMASSISIPVNEGYVVRPTPDEAVKTDHCFNVDSNSCSVKKSLPEDDLIKLTELEQEFMDRIKPSTPKDQIQSLLKKRDLVIQKHGITSTWKVKIIDEKPTHYFRYLKTK
jgi:hypothetical protein